MSQPRPRSRYRGLKRLLLVVAGGALLLVGLTVGGVAWINHFAPRYRDALVARIGQRIDARVTVDGLSLGWGRHGPILYVADVRIVHRGAEAPVLTADKLGFEFSLADLVTDHLQPVGVFAVRPRIALVAADSGLRLAHWPTGGDHPLTAARIAEIRHALDVIDIRNGELRIASPHLPGGATRLHDLDLSVTDADNKKLVVALSAGGPAWLSKIDSHATLNGPIAALESGQFSTRLRGLDPLKLAHLSTISPARLSGGVVDVSLHGRIASTRLVDTHLKIASAAVRRLGGHAGDHAQTALIPSFTALFDIDSGPALRTLDVRLQKVTGDLKTAPSLAARLHVDTRTPAVTLQARHLPSALALRLARWAVPKLADTDVQGELPTADLSWTRGQPMTLDAAFSDLRVDDPAVAFGPVSGRYRQRGTQHTLTFSGASGVLRAQKYLKGTLTVSDLTGGLSWQRDANGARHVSLSDLTLASREAHLEINGTLRLPAGGGSPIADITATASAPDVVRLLDHVPQAPSLPNPRLRDWLNQAITAGTLDAAHVSVRGALDRFPFPDAHGNDGFHMTLAGHGLDVRYKPDWPALQDARGKLTLDGDTLDLVIPRSKIMGVSIKTAHVRVPDVREPIMALTGQIDQAPAAKLLAFLGATPLRQRFGPLIRAIQLGGPADLALDLKLPLKPGLGDIDVAGTIHALGDTLKQANLPGPLTAIRGQIAFTGDGLSATGLSARLLGIPLAADLSTAGQGRQRIVAHATPNLPADRQALAHYLPAPWLVYAKGPIPLTVSFLLGGGGSVSPIEVAAQLKNTAIALPAPLAKPAGQPAPLQVVVDPARHDITADYDHDVHMQIALKDDGIPRRITVHVGDRAVQAPDTDGLWVGGHADNVDAIGWFDVVRHVAFGSPANVPGVAPASRPADTPAKSSASGSGSALDFVGGDLTVNRLKIGDRYVANPHVIVRPLASTPGWHVDLQGTNSQGQLTWTDMPGQAMQIAGNLQRLAIQTESKASASPSADNSDAQSGSLIWPQLSPMDLPALALTVQHFVIDGTDFGQARANAFLGDHGWHLSGFDLSGGALTGHLSADWQHDRGLTSAKASGHFMGKGLSRLVRAFGYPSPVKAKTTRIDADLSIAPNAAGLDLLHLNGHMTLALDNGTFLTVEPGPGRLLGLFNLYVLPKRLLTMNFRDVVDHGLAFSKVRAAFRIRNGQAYCQNALIKTPSSNIRITGRIGIATRDYDERVRIQPQIGGSVALASTVLGGPIVGAAVLAVQQILKKPIEHFTSISYRLKGQWDDPRIIEPKAETDETNASKSDAKANKTDPHPAPTPPTPPGPPAAPKTPTSKPGSR